jgi:hypothetical protein
MSFLSRMIESETVVDHDEKYKKTLAVAATLTAQ